MKPYAVALASIAVATAARLALTPALGPTALPYVFFFAAVAISARYGGWLSGTLAAVLSAGLANWFFTEPAARFTFARTEVISTLAFLAASAVIVATAETMHASRRRMHAGETERAGVAAALAESESVLTTTLSSIGDGVIATDRDGRVTFLNPEAERLTGWPRAEAIGQALPAIFNIVNEDTGATTASPVDVVLREGRSTGLANHTILINRNGSRTAIDDSAAPIRRPNGPVLGVVLVFRDVTQQRAADIAQAHLAAIVKYSGDAVATKNLDGIVQSWNASAERLFGYRADEIIGQSITLLIPPDRLHEETEILARLHKGQASERLETIRMTKDGRPLRVSVSVSPIRDREGRIVGASKVVHDVTESVMAKEALRQERELLATTLASIGDAVIVTDNHGLVTTLNARAVELTGWSQAEAAGVPLASVFRIVNEQTRETVENPVEKALRLGTIVGLANHTVLISKMGDERPIDDSAAPIRYPDGSVAGVVLVFRDITERRRAENALRASDRRKDEFLAVLSHELRNPLAPIRMAVGMLERIAPPEPQLRELQDVIDRQSRQLTRLLDDLLDISRIASGKITLRVSRTSLATAVSSAIEASRPHLDALGQTLELRMPGESIEVDGDLGRLAQVFANLINNASKFSDRGSRIAIHIEREMHTAVVRVIDSGVGIAADQLPRIFEMFTQLGEPRGRTSGGLGVGLWLAKTFVELHHGTIEALSGGHGRGAELVVRLPLHDPQFEQAASPPPSAPIDTGPPRRVLVADDNADAAMMLAETLGLAGHDVRVAHDGEAALELVEQFVPEVVILDIGMPGRDGYEVARRLREKFGASIRLLALTGWGQPPDRQRATDAGFDQHLTKPVELTDLYRAIRG